MGQARQFKQYGKSGKYLSELLPHLGAVADDLTFFQGIATDNFNHGPAKLFGEHGLGAHRTPQHRRLGDVRHRHAVRDLPGFVVLQSGPRGPRSGAALWASGFLPTSYQGVPFRSTGDPILDLSDPAGVSTEQQRQTIDVLRDLNSMQLQHTGDSEISTRISQYEMAFKMQSSGPELIDFSKESKATLDMYGAKAGEVSFANNCLLARRLVERGTRFVQLYHADWDHHDDLTKPLTNVATEIDAHSGAHHRPQTARAARSHARHLERRSSGARPWAKCARRARLAATTTSTRTRCSWRAAA